MAKAYHVPRSVVLGEGTRSITTFEYDEATGRPLRVITVHESPWTEEDYGWAAAYEEYLNGLCPRCKRPLSETTAMKDGMPIHAYVVDAPARCYCCDESIKKQEAHGKSGHVKRPDALIWTSRLKRS